MLKVLMSVFIVLGFTGCHVANSGMIAPINLTKSGIEATSNTLGSKRGEAECQAILFVAFGDCSIATAAKNGGITKIHSVDTENLSILGIYSKQKLIVTGE
ncbi:TRL-like family protein [Helicobacter anatolicus]|uniref:TRL-like family protein n=1 Tax=Helicobacter anatolicus TaxID=2905874 RepID=UPI001E3D39BD|nr:TRL-like family protein [Helicobacter anatolicus]MCE3040073.1 TRL-like family protein [Helicobacter anatolicus]